jgi:P pilus assembly chaperone PapD
MRHIHYLIFITLLSPLLSSAQGNLLITPMRVVFEGQKKIQELNLANTGNDTARYMISLIEIRMNSNGTFERISEPDSGQLFASKFLRFFPRSVILAPGEAQLIKVQLTKTGQLRDGEYRSHIYFRAVPDTKARENLPG